MKLLEGMRTQFITLPANARDRIVARLRESGIEVAPSTNKMPRRFRDAGEVLTCTQGGGSAELLIVRNDFLPEESRHLTAVLVFPRPGLLAELRDRATNARLRKTILSILDELRDAASGLQPGA